VSTMLALLNEEGRTAVLDHLKALGVSKPP